MNLYNIFEGLDNPQPATKVLGNTEADAKLRKHASDTADMAQGEIANKLGRMLPQPNKDPKADMQEDFAGLMYGTANEDVTEDTPVELDEVAMSPKAFAQAIATGQEKGVLVGFEFETCIPKRSIEAWKNGATQAATEEPRYNPNDDSWVDGKTAGDVVQGIFRTGKGFQSTFEHLFKYKNSVKLQVGRKDPYLHYRIWAQEKADAYMSNYDTTTATFKALSDMLKDPELQTMEIRYGSNYESEFGPASRWNGNGKGLTIEILKRKTGVDFGKRVPKAKLTEELAEKVRNAMNETYRYTHSPYDYRANRVANALDGVRSSFMNAYIPSMRDNMTPESRTVTAENFNEFCRETMGTDDLKELLKKKWAFRGRVNNATPVLKEQLWYFVTPGAPVPTSMAPRSYSSSSYMDGAEFLKANLKDVFGSNMEIFRGYHQATKQLDRWYIEPDGSLRANGDDSTAEVVSPPLPAAEAMAALRTWYDRAAQLNLYTNSSTGLHINVSIPGNLDVLKLAVFSGDQYVLKQFGRENNNYARSVIKSLKGSGSVPTVGSKEFKDAEQEMKELVRRISGDHFATVNFNGKYVSFRHAGGNYLSRSTDIANTVGRFVRSMIIASDPTAYRDEYIGKLVKLMKTDGDRTTGEKLPLSDIRQYASKGIPTVDLDVVVMPRDFDAPAREDIDTAVSSMQRWGRENYSVVPSIVPDPSVRERLLNSRGFASQTKEWIARAPDSMFYRATVFPDTRRRLEQFADSYSSHGNDRDSAFRLSAGSVGKAAVAIKYRNLVKQDNPLFTKAITALRGGSAKPLPLPGTKHAPAATPSPTNAQRLAPAQQEPNTARLAPGQYALTNSEGGLIDIINGSEEDALNVAQQYANLRNIQVFVNDDSGRVGGARPDDSQRPIIHDPSGRIPIPGPGARNQEVSETRIFHPHQKVNVVYNPHNSTRKIILAKAVDHIMANKVINTYVHKAEQDPTRLPVKATDFILQPAGEYNIGEEQGGMGVTSAGGGTTNDSTSPIHGFGEDTKPMSQASRELLRVARQSNPEAMSDTDAIYGYLSSVAKKTQDNYKQVNNILRQLDPLSSELDQTERELDKVTRVNTQQQDLLRRLNQRVNQASTQTLPSQKRSADVQAQKSAAKAEKEREVIIKKLDEPKKQEPVQQPVQQTAPKKSDDNDAAIKNLQLQIKEIQRQLDKTPGSYGNNASEQAKLQMQKSALLSKLQNLQSKGELAPHITPTYAQELLHDPEELQKELPFSEEEIYESRLYAMKKAGYEIL